MALTPDVLFNFQGIDNVSPVAQQIGQNVNMSNNAAGGLMNTISRLSGVFSGLNGLVMGVFGTMGLSTFKNMTYGMATARQEIKSLYDSVYHSDKDPAAQHLWDSMDELTNQGYVQLDDLSNAMNNFAMVTHSSAAESEKMATVVNKLGNVAILMGMDSYRVTAVMNSAVQGMNGNLNMLQKNLGINKKRLTDAGWSGAADDVQGYVDALERVLEDIDTSDLLDSTEGRVISLQKKFRIAGRNLGNYMLPPINAILDAFTQLNAQSNDLFASLIIVSTGVMSGFASIIPTINPFLQTWQILNDMQLMPNLNIGRITSTSTSIGRLYNNFKDLIGLPVAGWLKYATQTRILPYFDDLRALVSRTYLTFFKYSDLMVKLRTRTNILQIAFKSNFDKIGDVIGTVQGKIMNLAIAYGNLEGRANVLGRIISKSDDLEKLGPSILKQLNFDKYGIKIPITPTQDLNASIPEAIRSGGFLRDKGFIAGSKYEMIDNVIDLQTKSIQENREAQRLLRVEEEKGILTTMARALGIGIESSETVVNTSMKELSAKATLSESIAKADENKQQAISNILRLNEIGILSDDLMIHALYRLGLIDEATATELVTDTKVKQMIANEGLIGTEGILASINLVLIAQILLIVGLIIGLILIIDQIGKTLGWWDNWKEALDAVVNGLKRLWNAFINNPNVQGFIKDIQWIFNELGKAVMWVAYQVLQFFGWEDDGGEVDIVRGIIDVFGALGDMLGKVVNAVKYFFTVTAPVWQALFTVMSIPIRLIIGLLKGIVCILLGCSPGIVPALQTMANAFRTIFGGLASFIINPVGTILRLLGSLTGNFFTVARNIGQSLWNGLNSILGGMPQKVWQTFWNMVNNIKQIPQMVFNAGQQVGQGLYDGVDNAISGLTGGALHLPGSTADKKQQALNRARTMGKATKNYTNSGQVKNGHTINIGKGAIQLDARNLTTKESKQIMINALEGLTTYETVHTKKAAGQK